MSEWLKANTGSVHSDFLKGQKAFSSKCLRREENFFGLFVFWKIFFSIHVLWLCWPVINDRQVALQRAKKKALEIVSYPCISDKTLGNMVWKTSFFSKPLLWKLPGKWERSKSSTLTYLRRRNGKMKFETSQLILGQHQDKEPFSGFFAGLLKEKKKTRKKKRNPKKRWAAVQMES